MNDYDEINRFIVYVTRYMLHKYDSMQATQVIANRMKNRINIDIFFASIYIQTLLA